jgi:hypothetical protein
MVARATGVFGVVGPRVYGVTGVVGQPLDTSAWFPGCRLVHVDRTDSDDRESGCSEFLGCASLGVAHGGRGTIRTVTTPTRSGHLSGRALFVFRAGGRLLTLSSTSTSSRPSRRRSRRWV